MKKLFAIIIIACAAFTVSAQSNKKPKEQKPVAKVQPAPAAVIQAQDTTVLIPFHQAELLQAYLRVDSAVRIIHTLRIDAITRDQLDILLLKNQNLIQKRANAVLTAPAKPKEN